MIDGPDGRDGARASAGDPGVADVGASADEAAPGVFPPSTYPSAESPLGALVAAGRGPGGAGHSASFGVSGTGGLSREWIEAITSVQSFAEYDRLIRRVEAMSGDSSAAVLMRRALLIALAGRLPYVEMNALERGRSMGRVYGVYWKLPAAFRSNGLHRAISAAQAHDLASLEVLLSLRLGIVPADVLVEVASVIRGMPETEQEGAFRSVWMAFRALPDSLRTTMQERVLIAVHRELLHAKLDRHVAKVNRLSDLRPLLGPSGASAPPALIDRLGDAEKDYLLAGLVDRLRVMEDVEWLRARSTLSSPIAALPRHRKEAISRLSQVEAEARIERIQRAAGNVHDLATLQTLLAVISANADKPMGFGSDEIPGAALVAVARRIDQMPEGQQELAFEMIWEAFTGLPVGQRTVGQAQILRAVQGELLRAKPDPYATYREKAALRRKWIEAATNVKNFTEFGVLLDRFNATPDVTIAERQYRGKLLTALAGRLPDTDMSLSEYLWSMDGIYRAYEGLPDAASSRQLVLALEGARVGLTERMQKAAESVHDLDSLQEWLAQDPMSISISGHLRPGLGAGPASVLLAATSRIDEMPEAQREAASKMAWAWFKMSSDGQRMTERKYDR